MREIMHVKEDACIPTCYKSVCKKEVFETQSQCSRISSLVHKIMINSFLKHFIRYSIHIVVIRYVIQQTFKNISLGFFK